MKNREAATKELLYFIDQFAPGSDNRAIYQQRLEAMSDREFEKFIVGLESEEEILALFVPNLSKHKLNLTRNLKIADQLGVPMFERLYLTDPDTGQVYRTEAKHLILDLPLRRQAQMLVKKMSIPESNRQVDERSGQSSSKGSRVSYPELQVNAAKGLDKMVIELIKFRGGDTKAFNDMNRSILETGNASIDAITAKGPTSVKSTQTLNVLLKSMHLDTTLNE